VPASILGLTLYGTVRVNQRLGKPSESTQAYVGDRPVIESMAEELDAIVSSEVYLEFRRRLDS
jgi:hypothetical protein